MNEINRSTHLMHLVSNIKGILKFDEDVIDIIQAIVPSDIPGGWLKLHCMEVKESITNDFESNAFRTQVLIMSFGSTPRAAPVTRHR